MKDTISFLNLAEIMMEKTKRPLSSYEVWDEAQKSGESKKVKTEGKTPWQTIGAAIYYDMQSNASTIFYQYSKRPAQFYLNKYKGEKVKIVPEKTDKISFSERDLHPLVTRFV
jgi:hypothetical protein